MEFCYTGMWPGCKGIPRAKLGSVGDFTTLRQVIYLHKLVISCVKSSPTWTVFHKDTKVLQHESRNPFLGCRTVHEYQNLGKISSGAYGTVYRAREKRTGKTMALKCRKLDKEEEEEDFFDSCLEEIDFLTSLRHPSIVEFKEVVMDYDRNNVFLVMEYMENDLDAIMEIMRRPFAQSEVKCLMLQLLEGVKFLHNNHVLHRDLKTKNILLNNRGNLKICDFGISCRVNTTLKPYTYTLVTLNYRAPELLLGAEHYSSAIDMWSVGCIMAELLSGEVLFEGNSEPEVIDNIFSILGTPDDEIWPGFSMLPSTTSLVKQPSNLLQSKFAVRRPVLTDLGFDLLSKLLTYDPEKRITAGDALSHGWFKETPGPKSKKTMPAFRPQHSNS